MAKTGSNFQGLAFPKPSARRSEKRKQRAHSAAVVSGVRALVVERDGGCRACHDIGRHVRGAGRLQMHEIIYRSATRGRPIEERVSTANCVLLCEHHHADLHAKRLEVSPRDIFSGADGDLFFRSVT